MIRQKVVGRKSTHHQVGSGTKTTLVTTTNGIESRQAMIH